MIQGVKIIFLKTGDYSRKRLIEEIMHENNNIAAMKGIPYPIRIEETNIIYTIVHFQEFQHISKPII